MIRSLVLALALTSCGKVPPVDYKARAAAAIAAGPILVSRHEIDGDIISTIKVPRLDPLAHIIASEGFHTCITIKSNGRTQMQCLPSSSAAESSD